MTARADDARLDVEGVTVRFGGLTALDDVALEVARGEVVGVIGPNGAGKTTLFNVLCGFVQPDAGEVRWRGRSLAGVKPHQLSGLGIARTLQGVGLFAGLTSVENVMAAAPRRERAGVLSGLLGLPRADRDERTLRHAALGELRRLGVADAADALPGALPYGVQKRVAIARALAAGPELLLLDEPAGGLGGSDIDDLAEIIGSLRERMGVLLVEHNMDLVMRVCDRVVVLDFGQRIATGTPAEIQADERVHEAYLGVEVDVQVEDLEAGYGPVRAVRGVTFAVNPGSITAVLGANGAGKTTLLRTLTGLVPATAGRARLGDDELTALPTERIARLGVAHVPEGGGVIAELTVAENLRLGALRSTERDETLAQVLDLFPPLRERMQMPASTLSGGERQMVALGRALMSRPTLLLLDEPSLGLAPRVVAQTMSLLRRLRDEHGLTVLLVEQNAKGALSVADWVVVLNLGEVVAQDDPAKLTADEELRRHYLGF